MSQDLIDLSNKFLNPVEKKMTDASLKSIGGFLANFKRLLGTITEPFFRKGMGGRYYNEGAFWLGVIIWFSIGIASAFFASEASILALLGHIRILRFCAPVIQSAWIPIVVGIIMALVQGYFGHLNIKESERLNRTGVLRHSRSRGAAIWENEFLAFLKIEGALLLFNWPTAVLFGAGWWMNKSLRDAQSAAILDRYLDAMDKEIEKEHLKDSALGIVPPEMTFLYHQIDPKISPEVREKMASALVDEPISVIAKAPKRSNPPKPTPKQPTSQPEEEPAKEKNPSEPESDATKRIKADPHEALKRLASSGSVKGTAIVSDIAAQGKLFGQKLLAAKQAKTHSKKYLVIGLIALFVIGLVAGGAGVYYVFKVKNPVPRTAVLQVQQAPVFLEQKPVAVEDHQAQNIELINGILTDEAERVNRFSVLCITVGALRVLSDADEAKPRNNEQANQFEKLEQSAKALATSQRSYLFQVQASVLQTNITAPPNFSEILSSLRTAVKQMELDRQTAYAKLKKS